jgi:PEP-CTERM motif
MFGRNHWSRASAAPLFIAATALLVCAASASADVPLRLTGITTKDWTPSSVPITFSFGTSPSAMLTANFTQDGQTIDFPANGSPALSALTTALTNGSLDTLTFAVNAESFTRPESFFQPSGNADPSHSEELPQIMNGIDWQGLRIDYYEAWLASSGDDIRVEGGHTIVELFIFGAAPEPSSFVLAGIGGVFLFAARFARPRG